MNPIVKLLGIDPALRNTGLALAEYDLTTGHFTIKRVDLIQTENQSGKTVRQSSDDYRCASEMLRGIKAFIDVHKPSFAVAEVPTGTQSARGAFSNGVCCGVLAGVPIPLIQVNPTEVKKASVGSKNASKEDMINWATANWPDAGWNTRNLKGKVVLTATNEHAADACAAVAAGVLTAQFAQAMALYAGVRAAA